MQPKDVTIKKLIHHNETCLYIDFGFDNELISRVKQIKRSKWSSSAKGWLISYKEESIM